MLHVCYRKIAKRLGGNSVLDFFHQVPKNAHHFLYINNSKHYLINQIDLLFSKSTVTMFAENKTFVIHQQGVECCCEKTSIETDMTSTQLEDYISHSYPKQKFLKIIANILVKKDLLNSDLYFIDNEKVHVADFISFIINRFDKNNKPDARIVKLCKTLAHKNVKFPNVSIKNPQAKKLLC